MPHRVAGHAAVLLIVAVSACSTSDTQTTSTDTTGGAAPTLGDAESDSPESSELVPDSVIPTSNAVISAPQPDIDSTPRSTTVESVTEDLDSSGGVDGPVMYWRERPPGPTEAEMAEIGGTLVREGDCLFLESDGYRSNVLWEFGTRWIEERSVVRLPDGTGIPVGSELPARSGGEHPSDQLSRFTTNATVIERAEECAGPDGGVSVIQD